MEARQLIGPISALMAMHAIGRNWPGFIDGLHYLQRPLRQRAFENALSPNDRLNMAQNVLELDWIIAGAHLLQRGTRPGGFSDESAIATRLNEADRAGLLLARLSLYAHQLTSNEAGIRMTPDMEDAHSYAADRIMHYWSAALSEVGGDRSRLPSAKHLISALKQTNGVMPKRVKNIIRYTVDPEPIRT